MSYWDPPHLDDPGSRFRRLILYANTILTTDGIHALRGQGFGVNFQVMRRTHSSLMRELNVDPKTVADQLGHSVDVDLNVYSKTRLGIRKEAVDTLESALRIM